MKEPRSAQGPGRPEDRRSTDRVPARFEVRFGDVRMAARALRAYSLNLSVGGLCLRTKRPHDVGSSVSLSMKVAGEVFELKGQVAWVRQAAEVIGVRFVQLSPEDRNRLERVVKSLRS